MKASYKIGLVMLLLYFVCNMDRMAINMAVVYMAKDFEWTAKEIGWIMSIFFIGYSVFMVPGGILADRIGPRKVAIGGLAWWTIFTALTGSMSSLWSMAVTRFMFGVGEGIFPGAMWKVVSQWFTKKNRATANAIVLMAVGLGPAVTPLILAPIIGNFGWRASFYFLGLVGVVCVLIAFRYLTNSIYDFPGISKAEIQEFEEDAKSAVANSEGTLQKSGVWDLLKTPVVWVLFLVACIFNITMYGWLAWLPSYLVKVKMLDLQGMAMAASVPFFFATIGMMLGGWVSDKWFRGKRKWLVVIAQTIGGVCLWGFTQVSDVTVYMVLQCIAAFFLFMSSSAIWSMPMIMLPTKLMGSGSSFINTGGQIGGFITNLLIGYVIAWSGNDYAKGFDVMLWALVVTILLVMFGIREVQKVNAPTPISKTV